MTAPETGEPGSGLTAGRGGVYRVLEPVDTVATTLTDRGWRVVRLPEVGRTRDFYAGLRTVLGLPDWTGANLDALWDVLTDLGEPTALVWPHHGTFAVARPERWRRILGVLEERAAQDPPFALVLL
ncbi:MAG TPA: barstar family protein [Microlunatus sp.]|nr:barstar family protein [Microlunatus sp.]